MRNTNTGCMDCGEVICKCIEPNPRRYKSRPAKMTELKSLEKRFQNRRLKLAAKGGVHAEPPDQS